MMRILGSGTFRLPGDEGLAELESPPPVPGRFSTPEDPFSGIPYQEYKASLVAGEQAGIPERQPASKQSTIVKSLIQGFNEKPSMIIDPENQFSEPKNMMDPYQEQLDVALKDREANMNNSIRRAAANDITNSMLLGMGIDHRINSTADAERKRLEDIKLKNFQEGIQLPGKVQTAEKAKMDLENAGSLNDRNSAISASYRMGAKQLLGDKISDEALNRLSGAQIQNLLGDDLAGILRGIEDRSLRREEAQYRREDRALDRKARADLAKDRAEEKALEKSKMELYPGQKKMDEEAGQEVGKWEFNKPIVENDIQNLKAALKELKAGTPATGMFEGAIPDRFKPKSAEIKRTINSVTQKNLKEILGGQFARVEGEELLKRGYDDFAEPETNAKLLESLITGLEGAAREKDRVRDNLKTYGSLSKVPANERQSASVSEKKDAKIQGYADQHLGGNYEKAKKLLEGRGYKSN